MRWRMAVAAWALVSVWSCGVRREEKKAELEAQVEFAPRLVGRALEELDCALEAAPGAGNPRDRQVLEVMALRCKARETMTAARAARLSYLEGLRIDGLPLEMLPAGLAVAVSAGERRAREAAEARGESWAKLAGQAAIVREGPGRLLVEGKGWRARLEVVGAGEMTGDGVEDWLVQAEAWMTEGTWRNVRMLVLTRTSPDAPLRLAREITAP